MKALDILGEGITLVNYAEWVANPFLRILVLRYFVDIPVIQDEDHMMQEWVCNLTQEQVCNLLLLVYA